MDARDAYIKETLATLKERYDCSLQELIDAYHGQTTIPASVYGTEHTPLEATIAYLHQQGKNTKEIAQLLARPTSTITSALENSQKKGDVEINEETPHRIPTRAFTTGLSPAESIVMALHEQGKSDAQIAHILDKDPRNIWTLRSRAEKKRGERDE